MLLGERETGGVKAQAQTGAAGPGAALLRAAGHGHLTCVEALLQRPGASRRNLNPNKPRDGDGATALMLAARGGHTDCAMVLVDLGASVNYSNRWVHRTKPRANRNFTRYPNFLANKVLRRLLASMPRRQFR